MAVIHGIYILDTNTISDYLVSHAETTANVEIALKQKYLLYAPHPVIYEIVRGLIKRQATNKLAVFERVIATQFEPLNITDQDWRLAAQFWATAVTQGKQLSDVDLLIAALATRLSAIIVSADTDFDSLPITRDNWRTPPAPPAL